MILLQNWQIVLSESNNQLSWNIKALITNLCTLNVCVNVYFLKWVIIEIQFICLDFKCVAKASQQEFCVIYWRLLILGTEWKYVFIPVWKYQALISQSSANIIQSLGFYKINWIKWKKIQWTNLIPIMQCSSDLCLNSTSLYFAAPKNVCWRVISFGFIFK